MMEDGLLREVMDQMEDRRYGKKIVTCCSRFQFA